MKTKDGGVLVGLLFQPSLIQEFNDFWCRMMLNLVLKVLPDWDNFLFILRVWVLSLFLIEKVWWTNINNTSSSIRQFTVYWTKNHRRSSFISSVLCMFVGNQLGVVIVWRGSGRDFIRAHTVWAAWCVLGCVWGDILTLWHSEFVADCICVTGPFWIFNWINQEDILCSTLTHIHSDHKSCLFIFNLD